MNRIPSARITRFAFSVHLAFGTLILCQNASAELGAPPEAGKVYSESKGDSHPAHAPKSPSAVVSAFFDKLGKGDMTGMMETFANDAKWTLHGPKEIPFAGEHVGKEGIQAFIETFGKNAKPIRFEPKEFMSDKSKVVVNGYEEVVALPTGKTWKANWTMCFTVHRGKIILVDEALNTAPVLAAFTP